MGSTIKKYFFWVFISTIIVINIFATPILAQLPLLPKLNLELRKTFNLQEVKYRLLQLTQLIV